VLRGTATPARNPRHRRPAMKIGARNQLKGVVKEQGR